MRSRLYRLLTFTFYDAPVQCFSDFCRDLSHGSAFFDSFVLKLLFRLNEALGFDLSWPKDASLSFFVFGGFVLAKRLIPCFFHSIVFRFFS